LEEKVDIADICAVPEEIIAGELARSRAITQLPVLPVNPDLGAYAAEYAKSRIEVANVLKDYVALLKKQEDITTAPTLSVGLAGPRRNFYESS
jgi:hypothetical protein